VAVAKALRRQGRAGNDRRRASHAGGTASLDDRVERRPENQLVRPTRPDDDADRAVFAVMRQERRRDLVDRVRAEVDHQRRPVGGKPAQLLPGRHCRRAPAVAGENDGLGNLGNREFAAERGSCRGKGRHPRREIPADPQLVQSPHLLCAGAVDRHVT
jgi:hypothetical protein